MRHDSKCKWGKKRRLEIQLWEKSEGTLVANRSLLSSLAGQTVEQLCLCAAAPLGVTTVTTKASQNFIKVGQILSVPKKKHFYKGGCSFFSLPTPASESHCCSALVIEISQINPELKAGG